MLVRSPDPRRHHSRTYRADGDTIFRVEDILFKIHRYHLEESTVFGSMFGLPSGALPSQGQSDANPIVLFGDNPDRFRAFLFCFYSKYAGLGFLASIAYTDSLHNPGQLRINRMTVDDVERLVNMVPFAHKYLLQDCLLWALESLEHILVTSVATVPANQYAMILEVTTLCTPLHESICDRIGGLLKRQWIDHIKANGLPVGPALDIAEVFDLRDFLVELYCVVLDKLAVTPEPQRTSADGPLHGISSTHQLRMFSGTWFLSRAFHDFIKQSPPTIAHHSTCQSPHVCNENWIFTWERTVTRTLDVQKAGDPEAFLRKLDVFKTKMVVFVAGPQLGICSGAGREIDNAVTTFKTSLTKHFFVTSKLVED
ncbi:hypothetical protein DFH07DRAFT_291767 [Mycena maculata]|uniref:BTB domain-containing protein n=1 Tax=Mycena maculata TaxID=230809 RepID=A0AAD7JRW5_9AGAR|nr:hypothetical protein DFH07DRAFT_291767 [Mycena maculata]